jgi:predicted alpha/beta-hydrolase family hydrolase
MALLDKLKEELDRAGKAAQGALDEGKTRLEAFRTRQLADKAAQALGYAVFRAKQAGGEIDADTYSRLAATLATHDADASRYEQELDQKRREQRSSTTAEGTASAAADAAAAAAGAAAAAAANAADSAGNAAGSATTDDAVSG